MWRGAVLKLSGEDSQVAFEDDYPGEARLEAGRHEERSREAVRQRGVVMEKVDQIQEVLVGWDLHDLVTVWVCLNVYWGWK